MTTVNRTSCDKFWRSLGLYREHRRFVCVIRKTIFLFPRGVNINIENPKRDKKGWFEIYKNNIICLHVCNRWREPFIQTRMIRCRTISDRIRIDVAHLIWCESSWNLPRASILVGARWRWRSEWNETTHFVRNQRWPYCEIEYDSFVSIRMRNDLGTTLSVRRTHN